MLKYQLWAFALIFLNLLNCFSHLMCCIFKKNGRFIVEILIRCITFLKEKQTDKCFTTKDE